MKKGKNNPRFQLLLFLALFSFSFGLFENYRELWLASNHLSTISISHIITIAYVITALTLLFFSLKVSSNKLRNGLLTAIILKMITTTLLLCLDQSNQFFMIKFIMFFDIALLQLIVSSIYPLMMNIDKNDEFYTKKDVIQSSFEKIGFLIVSLILGKQIGSFIINYNNCLLLSLIFMFLSFIILLNTNVEEKKKKEITLKKSLKYFNQNKAIYLFLLVTFITGIAWSSMVGLKMLTLSETLSFSTSISSYIILGLGILSNILALLIVKYFRFKNDYLNVFFKYGARTIFYLIMIFTNSKIVLLLALIYLLLTDVTHGFIFGSFFVNQMSEEYTLIFMVLKYCAALIGNGVGTFICGLLFSKSVRQIGVVAFVLGLCAYMSANILVKEKNKMLRMN